MSEMKSTAGSSKTAPASLLQRKNRTFFTLQMDVQLIRSCIHHNPYQLGKKQWEYVLRDMHEIFGMNFLLRSIKERTNKLVEKFSKEELQYMTGTEEDVSELETLLHEVVGIIEASSAMINEQTNAEVVSSDEEEANTTITPVLTPAVSRPSFKATLRQEKEFADLERDEYLNEQSKIPDMAPGPKSNRRKRCLSPEDELIRLKQEHDHEIQLKRLKLDERKMEIEYYIERDRIALDREKLNVEKEKHRMDEAESKRRNEEHTLLLQLLKQTNDLFMAFTKDK